MNQPIVLSLNDLNNLLGQNKFYIKTRNARDGLGLRKIVRIEDGNDYVMVDHYTWSSAPDRLVRRNRYKPMYPVRLGYSSTVMTKNIIGLHELKEDGSRGTFHRVTFDINK